MGTWTYLIPSIHFHPERNPWQHHSQHTGQIDLKRSKTFGACTIATTQSWFDANPPPPTRRLLSAILNLFALRCEHKTPQNICASNKKLCEKDGNLWKQLFSSAKIKCEGVAGNVSQTPFRCLHSLCSGRTLWLFSWVVRTNATELTWACKYRSLGSNFYHNHWSPKKMSRTKDMGASPGWVGCLVLDVRISDMIFLETPLLEDKLASYRQWNKSQTSQAGKKVTNLQNKEANVPLELEYDSGTAVVALQEKGVVACLCSVSHESKALQIGMGDRDSCILSMPLQSVRPGSIPETFHHDFTFMAVHGKPLKEPEGEKQFCNLNPPPLLSK